MWIDVGLTAKSIAPVPRHPRVSSFEVWKAYPSGNEGMSNLSSHVEDDLLEVVWSSQHPMHSGSPWACISKLSDPCAVPWWHPSSAHKGYFSSRCSFFWQVFSKLFCLSLSLGLERDWPWGSSHFSSPCRSGGPTLYTKTVNPKCSTRQRNINWMSRCYSEEQVFEARRTTHSRHVRI